MFVGFGKRETTWQPCDHMVVKRTSHLQLSDPHIAKDVAATGEPLADVFDQHRYVQRLEAVNVAVGKREHGGLEAEPADRVLNESRAYGD